VAQRLPNRVLVDVHNLGGFRLDHFLAALAQAMHGGAALRQALFQECVLPVRGARRAPPILVLEVVGAKRVAVHEQRPLAADVGERRLGEELRARGGAEALAHQEVAVAVHHVEPRAGLRQSVEERGDHGVERLVDVVVADPVFEEIAEDVQGIGPVRLVFQELEEALVGFRPIFAQVKIGDEERPYLEPTTVMDSITTGLVGTFWCMPLLPVGTPTILFTTSMPPTILPNTV
jgi:hypothetical protein